MRSFREVELDSRDCREAILDDAPERVADGLGSLEGAVKVPPPQLQIVAHLVEFLVGEGSVILQVVGPRLGHRGVHEEGSHGRHVLQNVLLDSGSDQATARTQF